jgi:hypothetical protein
MIDHVKSKWQWRPRASLANRQSRLVPVHSRNCSKQIVLQVCASGTVFNSNNVVCSVTCKS